MDGRGVQTTQQVNPDSWQDRTAVRLKETGGPPERVFVAGGRFWESRADSERREAREPSSAIRLIAGTTASLCDYIADGTFSARLSYRLNIHITNASA